MATVTRIGFGQMGRPITTGLPAAGQPIGCMEIASVAEFARPTGGGQ
jgi:3-hydroxyisobutyrate dehydrogenase-like beta-hydroxyacid dehydrogenase